MKIVYCTDNLSNLGGIQRVTTIKASALARLAGNKVYIVVAEGKGKSIFPVDNRVSIIDVDIPYYSSDEGKSEYRIIMDIFARRKEHKKRLEKLFKEIQPDIIISTGTSEKFFLPSIVPKKSVVIREFHFFTQYRHLMYTGLYGKFKAYVGDFIDYKIKLNKYDQVYLLTEEDRLNWKNNKKVKVMPNPNSFVPSRMASGKSKKVIAIGRYDIAKRFDNLLLIWSKITHRFPDWHLEIWGEGEERGKLEGLIERLGIQKTSFLKGYSSNIEEQIVNSSIFALTSDFEGFGLVIIEAMSCGLAPICFACPTGPRDIITDGEDGFLIPVNEPDMFADKLALLMEDEQRRIEIGQKAIKRASDFTPDNITQRWMNEFERLKEELGE